MCSKYPNCGHAGPLVDRQEALGDRHCETVLSNHECPYLRAGCLGCTNTTFRELIGVPFISRNDIPIVPEPIDWTRRKLPPLKITGRFEGAQDAIHKLATNPLLLATNRRDILRLVTQYLLKRIYGDDR